MTKADIATAYKFQHQMMKLSAAWPDKNATLLYKTREMLSFLTLTALGITMLTEVLNDINNVAKLSDILYISITVIVNILKYSNLYVNRKNFVHMIQLLKNPIFRSYPDELDFMMVKTINFLQYLVKIFAFFILICGSLLVLLPLFDGAPLPFPFPYDLGNYRYVMYVFQCVGIGICGYNNAYLDTLPACFICVSVTQLEILANKITRIREQHDDEITKNNKRFFEMTDKNVIEKLRECVVHHKAIIEVVEYVEKTFTFGTFTQFVASAIIICNTLFRFIFVTVGSIQFFVLIMYLGLMLAELYMLCWFGNDIIWNSTNIVHACYSFKWYHCGLRVRKYLYIIMERSKRPLKITAFKFSTLSLSAFTSIMQWSYSYLTLLLRLYKK